MKTFRWLAGQTSAHALTVPVLYAKTNDKVLMREFLANEVAADLKLSQDEVAIVSQTGRKPEVQVKGRLCAEWQVSLSQTVGLVVGALSRVQIGIDVERLDLLFDWQPVAEEFFPSDLVHTWLRLSPEGGRTEFFRNWVKWEAALKCRGTHFGETSSPSFEAWKGLHFFDCDVGSDFVCSVALNL
jgi:phosphopantetheinyl transferase